MVTYPISLNTSGRPEFYTFLQNAQPFTINTARSHVLEISIIDDVLIFCLRNAQDPLNRKEK